MKKLQQTLIIILSVSFLSVIALSFDKETIKIKPFVTSNQSCYNCHKKDEDPALFKDVANSCSELCLSCHKNTSAKNHHEIDKRMDVNTPQALPLTRHDRIKCTTCHNIKIKRFDKKSWKAESLFDRTFNKKTKYKTYYLRIRNNEGKLCKNCH